MIKEIPTYRLARRYPHTPPDSPQDPIFKQSCTIDILGGKLAEANDSICRLQTERDAAFARANTASQQGHAAQQSAIGALTRAMEMQQHSQQENDALRCKLAAAEQSLKSIKMLCG